MSTYACHCRGEVRALEQRASSQFPRVGASGGMLPHYLLTLTCARGPPTPTPLLAEITTVKAPTHLSNLHLPLDILTSPSIIIITNPTAKVSVHPVCRLLSFRQPYMR